MATVIFNSDNLVQGTIATITSTPLGINTYAYNTNLSSLSTYSTLSINNLYATSTSIFNNLNSLSTNSSLNISNLQATMLQHQQQYSIKLIFLIYLFLMHPHYYHH